MKTKKHPHSWRWVFNESGVKIGRIWGEDPARGWSKLFNEKDDLIGRPYFENQLRLLNSRLVFTDQEYVNDWLFNEKPELPG